MPVYEYICSKCQKSFSVTETISQHGSRKAKCPACGSRSVEQVFSSFFAKTSKKS
jgi:putative FmdB family regulatory protein